MNIGDIATIIGTILTVGGVIIKVINSSFRRQLQVFKAEFQLELLNTLNGRYIRRELAETHFEHSSERFRELEQRLNLVETK